jgi:hypothetical protein
MAVSMAIDERLRRVTKFDTEQDAKAALADGHCSACHAEMTLLGTLPPIRLLSAINVFRCPVCNAVTSYEI